MGIALTDDHRELAEVARGFLTSQKARWAARSLLDATDEPRPGFWPNLVELGWLGLHIDEEYGGSGFGLPELVVVVEELGRAVAPGPFVPTVIASAVIAKNGTAEQKSRLLPGLIDGTVTAGIGLDSRVRLGDGVADGEAGIVLGAGLAGLLLIAAGDDVLVLERDRDGVSVDVPDNFDPTRRSGRVRLDNVRVSDADLLAGARPSALARARTLLAAEAVGGASDCVDAAVAYAKVRQQFGRTIATFQAVKHHCANMLVGAESGIAAVWDAARAAGEDEDQFRLIAAVAAALAFPAYVRNAELNIQVHGGIGFTWEHDAHLHLRRAVVTAALFGGDAPAADVFERTAAGTVRDNSLDLPPEAEELRTKIRADAAAIAALDKDAQLDKLIETGYVMPHWPKPWGRAADAVEQLVIEEEFRAAGIKRPDYGITGWVILTLIQHGTPWQIERFVEKALRKDEIWCQLFSEPDAGSDAASIKTRATRVEGGWKINGQKVWTSGAHYCARGLATVRTDPDAPKHAGITTVIVDMKAPEVEVRPLRQITGGSDFNEVFFNDLFVPDEDVVGTPNSGWTVARATLGNERVSIGGSGSFYEGLADQLVQLAQQRPDRLAGGKIRVGSYLAEETALRLLNLRRAARSVEGTGPGPEGNVTKLKLAEHMVEGAAIMAALLGPEVALTDGPGALSGRLMMGARGMAIAGGTSEVTRNQIAERILGMPRDPLIN
ncbi:MULTISPECIES: acyl-CoA dehydrogenase [Mycobacterium avium complex (MAC)]|uniref:Acyl-CoA dehydrogenase FadE22 n=1 Tax=Mycobacterium avium subsp. hominissuis TaxID=439334 RepID=A0AAI8SQF6_MYCAV|nr:MULTISPECIES: acyl-CoA dehydrogenase [Mycobacterium avium complex (MAC)]APT12254.1 acyl-CoA dehydrogenase [Mycobacterium avium subsp. hominissuis]ETZ47384.1 acyl-CoA dehydrogenase, C-terminal domain protein [Mycobacterium avium MAV_120809_2495]ETZ56532.1 acyl-CoA dehydrogenase, C-terminal domain protein [Mycobacterium sp. MAC_011194_8550]KDO94330.1 acyl-CoA dehydrogenase [Mycobacterium avium subsp. hominissuis A5]KDP05466.1 acyl-CoA dehydrogenase [Mycobacterium avium subsp. hominissuis 100]